MSINYQRQLSKYTNDVLSQVCTTCGLTVKPRKQDKIDAITNGMQMVARLPAKVNVLAIDVGVKNLSYCKLSQVGIGGDERPTLDIDQWKKIDLHEQYGSTYRPLTNDMTSLVDSKRYLSHLAFELVNDIVIRRDETPHVIVVENQRTRSNQLLSTLPNVLLNYTLENMVYSTIWTLQQQHPRLRDAMVMPMNASKMSHFWLNRFIDRPQNSQTKKLRIQLFFNWLYGDNDNAPFVHSFNLPERFGDFSSLHKSKYLLDQLGLPVVNNKIDDLIDSLLYGLTTHRSLQNQYSLLEVLNCNSDLLTFAEDRDKEHFRLIQKVIIDNNLELLNKPLKAKKSSAKTSAVSKL
jgi:cruciform cutting endonuclease 1